MYAREKAILKFLLCSLSTISLEIRGAFEYCARVLIVSVNFVTLAPHTSGRERPRASSGFGEYASFIYPIWEDVKPC